MKKSFLAIAAIVALSMALGLAACGSGGGSSSGDTPKPADDKAAPAETPDEGTDEGAAEGDAAEPTVDGSAWGYAGDDPVEAAIYKYLAEEIGGLYAEGDVTIPVVNIVHTDYANPDEVIVRGDYWVFTYNIEGDTLVNAAGGNVPGVMHVAKTADGYAVSAFDRVADGAGYAESAKELFGEYFDDYSKVHSDEAARNELKKVTISDYVNLNGLDVTKYQDGGQDPVELYTQ